MPDKLTSVLTAKTEESSPELTEELIRVRAYQLYEERGCGKGHDLDDWLRAEAEITGKKLATAAEAEATEDGGLRRR